MDLRTAHERLAQPAADAIFDAAMRKLDNHEVVAAEALLKKYLTDRYGTRKAEAARLASEAETALSCTSALQTLTEMDDEQFRDFQERGVFDDGTVTHPVLIAARNETLMRYLEIAIHRRETLRREAEQQRWLARHFSGAVK